MRTQDSASSTYLVASNRDRSTPRFDVARLAEAKARLEKFR